MSHEARGGGRHCGGSLDTEGIGVAAVSVSSGAQRAGAAGLGATVFAALWLLLSTVLVPAALTITVGILILVFYRESWDVAFGVLVLCFAVFAVVGSSITVFLLRRSNRLAQLQSEFLANISHDFRTPLTSIRLFTETLRIGRVSSEADQRRCLELIVQETERMGRLIDRVLTFRQLEERGGRFSLAPEEPAALVQRVLQLYELDQRAARRLQCVIEPHLPLVLVDAEALTEALRNLVQNALAYSPAQGPVVVTARSDGDGVAFAVRDQGPEIVRAEQRRIFKRFYRIPGTGSPGSGLGLSIAMQIARAHGGQISLKSARGVGNVFTLRLSRVVPSPEAGKLETNCSAEPGGSAAGGLPAPGGQPNEAVATPDAAAPSTACADVLPVGSPIAPAGEVARGCQEPVR